MVHKAWKIIPRAVLESVLNNYARRDCFMHPLVLHGPRGVGKTTLILERLLGDWNKGPHLAGYVDFARSIEDHHPDHNQSFPWSSWSNFPPPPLPNLIADLENCLESMAYKAVRHGAISSHEIFSTLNRFHNPKTALRRILDSTNSTTSTSTDNDSSSGNAATRRRVSTSALWDQAVCTLSARSNAQEINGILGLDDNNSSQAALSLEEASCYREAIVALRLAKEVIRVHQGWRANAVAYLNQTGGFSRTLAQLSAGWPCLLLELLCAAVEFGYFQPKLVINNIDVLRNAMLVDDSTVSASQYHDTLLRKIIDLCDLGICLPIILVTSDSYYSYQADEDFGSSESQIIFFSCENFGWTAQVAKIHMVPDYFTESESKLMFDVIGSNPRHLFELYALKQSNHYQEVMGSRGSTFAEILDAYLAYLQVTEVNPAMDHAQSLLQKFALDARNGRISKKRLCFGAPWRHPPHTDNPTLCLEWAKIQLMDFLQSLVYTEFGVNYIADCTLEILEDPCALALVEVGLLYVQRDPPFIRAVTRAIQRCLVRWLIQERLKMNSRSYLRYLWQRIMRGRSYRHLIYQLGYQ